VLAAQEADEMAPPPQDTMRDSKESPLMTPFLKDSFPDFVDKDVSRSELELTGQNYLVKYFKNKRLRLLNYIKNQDNETALNALFVLSEENQNLPKICGRMSIDKVLFLQMAYQTVQRIL